jgi:hypothetical protein
VSDVEQKPATAERWRAAHLHERGLSHLPPYAEIDQATRRATASEAVGE